MNLRNPGNKSFASKRLGKGSGMFRYNVLKEHFYAIETTRAYIVQ